MALLSWFSAAILLLVWLLWFFFSTVTLVEVSRSAHLEVQDSASPVSAVVSGKIIANFLVLGQEVLAGDILIKLDSTNEELRLREEQSRLASFEPRIHSLNKELDSLTRSLTGERQSAQSALQAAQFRAEETTAALNYAKDFERRMKEESAAGSVSQVESLKAASEVQKLNATRSALRAEINRLESDLLTREQQSQIQLENLRRSILTFESERSTSEATVARLKNDIEKHLIRSPISGKVGDMNPLRIGAFIGEGQKFATIVPDGKLIIVAEFLPSAALGRIQVGQQSRMRLDGFPWGQFGSLEAKVARVASEIRDQVVRIELVPTQGLANKNMMQHGLPGSVSVNLEQVSPAQMVLRVVGQWGSPKPQPVALLPPAEVR
jgi:membrane fusion protein (multidrug efflux system)